METKEEEFTFNKLEFLDTIQRWVEPTIYLYKKLGTNDYYLSVIYIYIYIIEYFDDDFISRALIKVNDDELIKLIHHDISLKDLFLSSKEKYII